jgi:UDP-2,3-diacylglucosamine pyrophosphatase LpxH
VDGIICGHIHHAAIETIGGVRYINTGDWVESCTAIAEHHDGRFEIITWAKVTQSGKPADAQRLEVVRTAAA